MTCTRVVQTVLIVLVALAIAFGTLFRFKSIPGEYVAHLRPRAPACRQADLLFPHTGLREDLDSLYASPGFLNQSTERLARAVQFETVTYDDMGPADEDPRWAPFRDFHIYLEEQFPLVHSKFSLKKIETLSLVYTWNGSDPSLSPILLAAHQDVVPVDEETAGEWVEGSFSGTVDDGWLWGRGSCDDKGALISILESLESLIDYGFSPRRTIVLAFGHDEEIGGLQGARHIAEHLQDIYGENSFAMLVDEGGFYTDLYGATVAYPGVAEKGSLNVRVEVDAPGGHSSVPPAHTSIGMLSALLVELENHPQEPHLTRDSTTFQTLQCLAEHTPDIPHAFRQAIWSAATSDMALYEVEQYIIQEPLIRSLLQTTQAATVISGGVKVNALPEQAWALINHRIATYSSVGELQRRIAHLATPIARRFGISLNVFGEEVRKETKSDAGSMRITDAFGSALEPSPRTPTDYHDAAYRLFSGTIRAVLQGHTQSDVIVTPGMMTGNTDTKHYWSLTRHIFRYYHFSPNDLYGGLHTINEAIRVDSIPGIVRFYSYLILNADESDALD